MVHPFDLSMLVVLMLARQIGYDRKYRGRTERGKDGGSFGTEEFKIQE
jgi:hypothetical protein